MVHQPEIAGRGLACFSVQRRKRQEAEHVESIVDGDYNDPVVGNPLVGVITTSRALLVASAVNEDEDRERGFGSGIRRTVDVQVEAVFTTIDRCAAAGLRTIAGGANCIAHASPALGVDGRLPAKIADWRRGIGDTKKRVEVAIAYTLDQSLRGWDSLSR